MMMKRLLVLAFVLLCCGGNTAQAVTFADYAYAKVKDGDVKAVSDYVAKGYDINKGDTHGITALCKAMADKDFNAYRRLRKLGASAKVDCMAKMDQRLVQQYENTISKYPTYAKIVPENTSKTAVPTVTAKKDNTLLYGGLGLLAAGGVAALVLSNKDGSSHHSGEKHNCPAGQSWNGLGCVCPTGEEWNGETCEKIVCPDGTELVGDACVERGKCPSGQRLVNGECVEIKCPKNTHLVGNICVADEEIEIVHKNDNDLYGIASDAESIFNLYSSPSHPDDESEIILKNKGNGDVRGLYGYSGEVFNSYVIGDTNSGEYINKKPIGTGTIEIIDEGKGTVYGMYSHISDITQYKEAINASGFNNGTAYGNIKINHTGGGATYGLAGDVRAYNAYVSYAGKAYGDIDIVADGDIYGIYGYVAATNAVNHFYGQEAKGDINLTSKGDGNVYGIMINKSDIPGAGAGDQNLASWFAFNAYTEGGNAEGVINITNYGDGNVYGMYGGQQLYNAMSFGGQDEDGNPTGHAKGVIKIKNTGDGDVYGMYMPEADTQGVITNENKNGSESVINIQNAGTGVVTGMRGGKGTSIINSGDIIINHDGTSVGIYGESKSKINNSGKIEINGYRYSSATGPAYGIYAEKEANVINSGEIKVNARNGAGIYLEEGATLENTGTVIFSGTGESIVQDGAALDIYGEKAKASAVDLNELGGGEIVLGQNGKFIAESLSGNMTVSEKITQGSSEDYFVVKNALQADNTDNLTLASKSAMFEADKQEGEKGYDVVLKRHSFDSLLENKDAAQFWETNYQQEQANAIFDDLKTAATEAELEQKDANYRGEDVLPSFRRENALLYNHLSRQFNENLFDKPNETFMGGYKYIDISRKSDGLLVGNDGQVSAAYAMLKGKTRSGMTYGLGGTISQLKSDYDNGSSRKSNLFGLWLPAGYDFRNGTQWYSKLYAGYEDGSYDRKTPQGKYSSDITSYQYGVSNELRHNINLGGGLRFTPAAELNLLGIYQDGYDEGSQLGALHSDKENILSLEGGLGAYLSKEMNIGENHQLGIQIGGIYYVEFLDPDEGTEATLSGMRGRYKIKHQFDDDRAVVSARINYNYKNLTLYGMIERELKNYKGVAVDVGLQYNL